jgi:hypothetical protein
MHKGLWPGTLKEGHHKEDVDIEGRVILKWILMKWDEGRGLDAFCLKTRILAYFHEHSK